MLNYIGSFAQNHRARLVRSIEVQSSMSAFKSNVSFSQGASEGGKTVSQPKAAAAGRQVLKVNPLFVAVACWIFIFSVQKFLTRPFLRIPL
jgi:hypothetical protein